MKKVGFKFTNIYLAIPIKKIITQIIYTSTVGGLDRRLGSFIWCYFFIFFHILYPWKYIGEWIATKEFYLTLYFLYFWGLRSSDINLL